MRLILRLASQLLVCGAFLVSCSSSPAPGELLAPQIRALEQRADLIRDANDIKRLQRAYGFYWDKGMWNDVADLFTADATIQYGSEAASPARRGSVATSAISATVASASHTEK